MAPNKKRTIRNPQKHNQYVRKLLIEILEDKFVFKGKDIQVKFVGFTARIDGIIRNQCAIEVESRTPKQVKGALVDLLFHPLDKKLLILVPTKELNPIYVSPMIKQILNTYKSVNARIEIAVLCGNGNDDRADMDKKIIIKTLKSMGISIK